MIRGDFFFNIVLDEGFFAKRLGVVDSGDMVVVLVIFLLIIISSYLIINSRVIIFGKGNIFLLLG